jgi:hypothetical protein
VFQLVSSQPMFLLPALFLLLPAVVAVANATPLLFFFHF